MLKKFFLFAAVLCGTHAANAQGLGALVNSAKQVAGQAMNTAQQKVQQALVGNQTISANQLAGTWVYQQPLLVFESNNVVNQLGAAALADNVEKSAEKYLVKVGIQARSLSLAFTSNGHYTATLKGRKVSGTYTLKGSTLTLVAPQGVASVPVNAKLQGNQLQLSVHADKLIPLLQTLVGNVPQLSDQSTMITSLLKQYKGALVGLRLKK